MSLRDAWYPVLFGHELPAERALRRKLFGDPLVLFRDEAGRPTCFLDVCPHRSVPLSLGKVHNGQLVCSYHGWHFEGSGRCVRVPLLPQGQSVPKTAMAGTYPCIERDGAIWVFPGDTRLADSSPLPLPTGLSAEYALTNQIHKDIPCRYDYLIEHVLDLPHFYQVHTKTLFRLYPASRTSPPEVVDVRYDADAMTMKFQYKLGPRMQSATIRVYRPCHKRVDLELPGGRSMVAAFFNTPTDEAHTRGNLFIYRNFFKAPGMQQLVNWLIEATFYKAINEDMHIFKGQTGNLAMNAKSTTGYYFDSILNGYHKWQRHDDAEDLWFKGFDHVRRRCAASTVMTPTNAHDT